MHWTEPKLLDFYKRSYETFKLQNEVSWNEYYAVAQTFFEILMRNMMEEGYLYSLPFSLGIIGILKRKAKANPIDWVATKQSPDRKLVRIKNAHSELHVARFKWRTQNKYVFKPSIPSFWKFKASRDNQRKLAKYILQHNTINKYYSAYDY